MIHVNCIISKYCNCRFFDWDSTWTLNAFGTSPIFPVMLSDVTSHLADLRSCHNSKQNMCGVYLITQSHGDNPEILFHALLYDVNVQMFLYFITSLQRYDIDLCSLSSPFFNVIPGVHSSFIYIYISRDYKTVTTRWLNRHVTINQDKLNTTFLDSRWNPG